MEVTHRESGAAGAEGAGVGLIFEGFFLRLGHFGTTVGAKSAIVVQLEGTGGACAVFSGKRRSRDTQVRGVHWAVLRITVHIFVETKLPRPNHASVSDRDKTGGEGTSCLREMLLSGHIIVLLFVGAQLMVVLAFV